MRTTLTLDDDVAARLKRLSRGGRFKDLVNDVLRRGLERMETKEPRPDYRVRAVKGRPRRTDLDNVAEVLAEIEGDRHS
jgi:Arc/MetJ-type ribon-helix-helix transcriptional regulator